MISTCDRRAEGDFAALELSELRREALQVLGGLLLVFAYLLLAVPETIVPTSGYLENWVAKWIAIVLVAASGFVALGLLRWGPTPAGLALTGALIALCLTGSAVFGSIIPLFALPLATMVAAVSVGNRTSFAAAGLAGLVVLLLPLNGLAPYSVGEGLAPLLVIVASAVVGWLGARPSRVALTWALRNYSRMRELAEQLREHRAELADALKNLDHAYYQLARASEDLARARLAAEEARRLKAEFAANLSHELRTPLNLIIGFSEMMLFAPRAYDSARLPAEYQGDVEAVYRNARHLSALVDDVLELGEIEAGRMGLRKDWACLRDIVDEAAVVVATLFEDKGLTIRLEVPPDLPTVYVDRTRVRQVIINLLNNAVRFTDQGGVRVAARHLDDHVQVSIEDTGVGISVRDLPHVFEEFRQFETAYQRRVGGSGLGLAICKKFVELHGGNIRVESTVNEGATFCFTLPLVTNVAGLPMRAPWETWVRLTGSGVPAEPLVLVASHDPGPARLFQRHLDGYRVLAVGGPGSHDEAESAKAIIHVLGQDEELEASINQIPFPASQAPVLTCCLPSEHDLRQELGVIQYLLKPFTREQLLAAVRQVRTRVRTVLIVDDDPAMVDLIARTLLSTRRRYRIVRAFDGTTALEILRQEEPPIDLLVLDLLMAPPDGFAVLKTIRADPRLAQMPVIVESARGLIDRGIAARALAITRAGGFSIREVMACTRALLQALEGQSTHSVTA